MKHAVLLCTQLMIVDAATVTVTVTMTVTVTVTVTMTFTGTDCAQGASLTITDSTHNRRQHTCLHDL